MDPYHKLKMELQKYFYFDLTNLIISFYCFSKKYKKKNKHIYSQQCIFIGDLVGTHYCIKNNIFNELTFVYACRKGYISVVKKLLWHINNFDYGLREACKGHQWKIIHYLTRHGANDWGGALSSACVHGHLDIIKFILSKVKIKSNFNYKKGFYYACIGGHLKSVQHMVKYISANDFIKGFKKAKYHKHILHWLQTHSKQLSKNI